MNGGERIASDDLPVQWPAANVTLIQCKRSTVAERAQRFLLIHNCRKMVLMFGVYNLIGVRKPCVEA